MAIEPRTDEHLIAQRRHRSDDRLHRGRAAPRNGRDEHGAARWRTPTPHGASDFLIEHMEGSNPVPSYCGVRTETQKFVRYATGERELYDLSDDPDEMVN